MSIQTGVNSTSPNAIKWAGAGSDPYVRASQLAGPVENFDLHDHSDGKCLPVARAAFTNATPVTVQSQTALTVARTGTNYAFQVDTNTASSATGLKVTAAGAGSGVALAAISSGTDEGLTIDAKGAGQILIGAVSTGAITLSRAVTASNGVTVSTGNLGVTSGNITVASGVLTVSGGAASSFAGVVHIGDNANADLTLGLNVNQAAADDEILTFKSSDVAHGMTSLQETDTWFSVRKNGPTSGGAWIRGWSETTEGLRLAGYHTTDDSTKTTSSSGAVAIVGSVKSGTSAAAIGSTNNILTIIASAGTRFIFCADGNGYADTAWTTYDTHDDLALIANVEEALLSREVADDPTGKMTERRRYLEEVGIIPADSWHLEDDRPRAMVNYTRLAQLHHGALIQVGQRFAALEADLADTKARLALAEGR